MVAAVYAIANGAAPLQDLSSPSPEKRSFGDDLTMHSHNCMVQQSPSSALKEARRKALSFNVSYSRKSLAFTAPSEPRECNRVMYSPVQTATKPLPIAQSTAVERSAATKLRNSPPAPAESEKPLGFPFSPQSTFSWREPLCHISHAPPRSRISPVCSFCTLDSQHQHPSTPLPHVSQTSSIRSTRSTPSSAKTHLRSRQRLQ